MMSSDQTTTLYTVRVKINQPIKGMLLRVTDSQFKVVTEVVANELSLSLAKGLYLLRMCVNDYTKEEFIIVEDEMDLSFDVELASAAPVLPYKTTHEYYSDPAELYSKQCSDPATAEASPNFFLFLAKYQGDFQKAMLRGEFGEFAIYALNKADLRVNVTAQNSSFDPHGGCLCFSSVLPAGQYFLEHRHTNEKTRIFPVYILTGFQTQFFLRYNSDADHRLTPNYVNMRIFFSKASFDRTQKDHFLLDKILLAYKNYKNYDAIDAEDKALISQSPYLTTLHNILHTVLGKGTEIKAPELDLPDVAFANGKTDPGLSDRPPVMSFILQHYITHAHETEAGNRGFIERVVHGFIDKLKGIQHKSFGQIIRTIEPSSVVDRVMDHACYDSFWSSFTAIAEPDDWKSTYEEFLQEALRKYTQSGTTHLEVAAGDVIDTVVDKSKDKVLAQLKANAIFDQLRSVRAMSKEFNLPMTMIIRNYKEFSESYEAIRKMKGSMKKDPTAATVGNSST